MLTTNTVSGWVRFSEDLVTSGEIDPPYYLIHRARRAKGEEWAAAFALYYFMFYELSGAVEAANNHKEFWDYCRAVEPTAKRGKARRHFRAAKSAQAVARLSSLGDPTQVWRAMYADTYSGMLANLNSKFAGCEIGPYFAWKAADILDRGLGTPVLVSMSEAVAYMPSVPRKGAKDMFPHLPAEQALQKVANVIYDLHAPGNPSRMCSYPEAETILCAMYGYRKGTYVMGSDIVARRQELAAYPELANLLPTNITWSNRAYSLVPQIVSA